MSDRRNSVRPIPSSTIHAALDRKPTTYVERYAANDRDYREAEKRAWGGRIGFGIVMFAVVFIVLLLATGGQL